MIDNAESIDQLFGQGVVQLLFILVGILGFVGMVLYSPRRDPNVVGQLATRSKYFWLSASLVVFPVLSAFSIMVFLIFAANKDIDLKISSGVDSASVDGRFVVNPSIFADTISRKCNYGGKRSHPETRHNVLIETRKGSLHLQLGQDSVERSEYWVFYPKFALTSSNEVRRACELGGIAQ